MILDGPLIETLYIQIVILRYHELSILSTWDFVASIQRCILLLSSNLTIGFPLPLWILVFSVYIADGDV